MGRHAYTLVEVLAVTVLLGLLATLGVPPLLRTISGDPLGKAADRLVLAFRDTRAKSFGRPANFTLEPWGFSADGVTDPAARLPDSIRATWTRNGLGVRQLLLDSRGHGPDTDVLLRLDDRELRFALDGLTGLWTLKAAP